MNRLVELLCRPRRRRVEAWASVYACTFGCDDERADAPDERAV